LTSSVIRPPPPSTLFPYTTLFRSFLRLLRCFSSPGSPRYPIDSGNDPLKRGGCPIRISPDQRLLAPPRSFSQHATSFIASMRQGIHQMPLKRLISALLVMHRSQTRRCLLASGAGGNIRSLRLPSHKLGRPVGLGHRLRRGTVPCKPCKKRSTPKPRQATNTIKFDNCS